MNALILSRVQAAALITANPGTAVSLAGEIARIVPVVYCPCRHSDVALDHICKLPELTSPPAPLERSTSC